MGDGPSAAFGMRRHILHTAYPVWVTVLVASSCVVYLSLLVSTLFLPSVSVYSNLHSVYRKQGQNSTEEPEMELLHTYTLQQSISTAIDAGAYATAVLVLVCSFLYPLCVALMMLYVWFGNVPLRRRGRIIRVTHHTCVISLFYFFQNFLLCVLLNADFPSFTASGDSIIEVRVLPTYSVYVFVFQVVMMLLLTLWVGVLHYNATYWFSTLMPGSTSNAEQGVPVKPLWYFGTNPCCAKLCCTRQLVKTFKEAPPSPRQDGQSRASKRQTAKRSIKGARASLTKSRGWHRKGQAEVANTAENGKDCCAKPKFWLFHNMATDMELISGNFKYSCSYFGLLLLWFAIAFLVVLLFGALFLPVFRTDQSVNILDTNATTTVGGTTIYRYSEQNESFVSMPELVWKMGSSPILDGLVDNDHEHHFYGIYFMTFFYYVLVVAMPILQLVLTCPLFFCNLEAIAGARCVRVLYHSIVILSQWNAFPVCIVAFFVTILDFNHAASGMLGFNRMFADTGVTESGYVDGFGDSNLCYHNKSIDATLDPNQRYYFCLGVEMRAGAVVALLYIFLHFPYWYYCHEIYHRHYGLLADGRNEQYYTDGTTTRKTRCEGCVVASCATFMCCKRIEHTFEQEAVDENEYYRGGEEDDDDRDGSTFTIPEKWTELNWARASLRASQAHLASMFSHQTSRQVDEGDRADDSSDSETGGLDMSETTSSATSASLPNDKAGASSEVELTLS